MPKTSKNRKHNKNRQFGKKKTKAGFAPATAREALASLEERLAQDYAEITQSINRIVPTFRVKAQQYEGFINSVTISYEYKRKNIPAILLTLISQVHSVLERVKHIIRFHSEPEFLQAELARHGYNSIVTFIGLTVTNMENLEDTMARYSESVLRDYSCSQLGVETQPALRNRTIRRTDAIVRPPRTERTRALIRRIRSI
jgi:hypothetical protein